MQNQKLADFINYLSSLTADERHEIFGELHDVFCPNCGEITNGRICYCECDE